MWHPYYRFGSSSVVPPIPPVVVDSSGGYWPGYVRRKESVREQRERLGIIPKAVRKIIKSVVAESIIENKTEVQAVKLFEQELETRDLAYKAQYAAALESYRNKMIEAEIYKRIRAKKKQDDDEDDEQRLIMLLM